MSKGIDIRATSSELLFRAFLQDSTGAKVTSGTTSLRLYELQMSDGTLKSYDFNDNTFKTGTTTTETGSMTHRTGNNGGTSTGIWSYRLATLTGFTSGNVYFASVNNSSASPTDQVREFQFGSGEGDLAVNSSGHVSRVTLVDTLTTYTNDTPQSGDAFARIGALGAGLTSLAPSATALSTAQWTNARAALLDNLSNLDAAISSLNNLSALANLYGSPLLEIPDSASTLFAFTFVVRDNEGKLKDLDGSPTIAAANAAGTDRSANLSAVSHPATGRYTFTYSVSSAAAEESLRITCSGTISAEARYVEWIGAVVNYDSLTAISAIKAKTDLLPSVAAGAANGLLINGNNGSNEVIFGLLTITGEFTVGAFPVGSGGFTVNGQTPQVDVLKWKGATAPAMTGDAFARLGLPAGASLAADVAAVKTDTGNLATRITSTLFAGITSLAQWLGLIAGKQVGNSTARTELRATGTGSGTFDETTDSQEALRDRGDAAWLTGSGSGGAGTGARTVTISIVDGSSVPLQNATVRLTEGVNTFTANTNASGAAVFNVNDATYAVAVSKAGYSFGGATLPVAADISHQYAMTALVVPSATSPGMTTAYIYAFSRDGQPAAGIAVDFILTAPNRQGVWQRSTKNAISDSNGLISLELVQSAEYDLVGGGAGSGRITFTTGTDSTYAIRSTLLV